MAAELKAQFTLTLKDAVSPGIEALEKRLARLSALARKLAALGDLAKSLNVEEIARGADKSSGALQRLTAIAATARDTIASIGKGAGGGFGQLRSGVAGVRRELAGAVGQVRTLAGELGHVGHGLLTAGATGFGLGHVIGKYAEYDDIVRHIAITAGTPLAGLEPEIVRQMATYNRLAIETAQPAKEIANAAMFLLTDGLSKATVDAILPSIARAATAYRGTVPDGVAMAFTMHQNLGVHEEDMQQAISMAALAGRLGHVTFADQSRLMPTLAPSAKGVGTGVEGTAKLLAMLETVKRGGAGTSDQAMYMLKDFFDYLNSPFGKRSFAHGGIDLLKLKLGAEKAGTSPVEAVIAAIQARTAHMTPVQMGDYIGKIFHNTHAQHAYQALDNQDAYRREVEAKLRGVGLDTINEDSAKAEGPETKLRRLQVRLTQITDRFGRGFAVMLDPFNEALAAVLRGMDKVDAVFTRLKRTFGMSDGRRDRDSYDGLGDALNTIIGYVGWFIALTGALAVLGPVLRLLLGGLRLLLVPVRLLVSLFGLLFGAMRLAASAGALLLRGLLVLGGAIAAIVGLPVELVVGGIAAIGAAAFLLYEYWEPVKAWFGRLWEGIKTTFTEFVTWITTWASSTVGSAVDAVKQAWQGLKDIFTDIVKEWTTPIDRFIADFEAKIKALRNSSVGRAMGLATEEGGPGAPGVSGAPGAVGAPGAGVLLTAPPAGWKAEMNRATVDVRVGVDPSGRLQVQSATSSSPSLANVTTIDRGRMRDRD